ncbi:MAG: hypothetical protein A2284_19260 [Deltaproteobacteria bacterium RIFOXYA12_FULL_61_11]|nr:MAG: hypothetical protein A2284_19260 [Deltaproteobacteria bacterium RIFOXYA12_FULL_61_11]
MPAIFLFLLVLPTILSAAVEEERKTFPGAAITALEVHNNAGRLKIVAGSTTPEVVATKRVFEPGCRLSMELLGSKLVVKVTTESEKYRSPRCDVDLTITIPKRCALDLHLGSCDATVFGTEGDLEATFGSGDLEVQATLLRVTGRSGSGDVELKGTVLTGEWRSGSGDVELEALAGPFAVTTGSGEIELTVTTLPVDAKLNLRSGSGDIEVTIPAQLCPRPQLKSGSGTIVNDLAGCVGQAFDLEAVTGSGDLVLKKGK